MKLSGQNQDHHPPRWSSEPTEVNRPFVALVAALQAAGPEQALPDNSTVDQLLAQTTDDLEQLVRTSENKRLPLQKAAWQEFRQEISPYYLALLSQRTPEHAGFMRFERPLKAAYILAQRELIDGRHRENCERILALVCGLELRQIANASFPGLREIVTAVGERGNLSPSLAHVFLSVAKRIIEEGSLLAAQELSDAGKMMASGYLCMPAVRGSFSDEIINSVLLELRPSLPPFPGEGKYPRISDKMPPLPSSNSLGRDRDLREQHANPSPNAEEMPPKGQIERQDSFPYRMPPAQLPRYPDSARFLRFASSILEHLPNEKLDSLLPLVSDPAFRAACLLNASCFDWIVDHARAFCAAAREMARDWGDETDSEVADAQFSRQVTLSSSTARLATECTRNMLDALRYEACNFLEARLLSHCPELARLKPLVRTQLLWSFPRGDYHEDALDRALVLENPDLLQLLCPYVPVGRVTRMIIERGLGQNQANRAEVLGHPNEETNSLFRFILRNAQSITAPLCLSPLVWHPVDLFSRSYGAWLGEQEIGARETRRDGNYLIGCNDFAEIARTLLVTDEHRRRFAASLHADYLTPQEGGAPDRFLRAPGLVARALFPLEALRETLALWDHDSRHLHLSSTISLPAIPGPEEPRHFSVALRGSPSGKPPETLLLRPLCPDRFFAALGYSPEEVEARSLSGLSLLDCLTLMKELPAWRCFQAGSTNRPPLLAVWQLFEAQKSLGMQPLEIGEALLAHASQLTVSVPQALQDLSRLRARIERYKLPCDIAVCSALWKEVAVGLCVLREPTEQVDCGPEAVSFDQYMQLVFRKVCDESLGLEAYSPVDILFIANLLGADRHSLRRPVATTLSEALRDLASGRTRRTPSWMTPQTVTLKTHPYTDPFIFFLDSAFIQHAVAEHDAVRHRLVSEKSDEITAWGDWNLVRSVHSSFTVAEDEWTAPSSLSPLELFFRAIGMGPYEQRELDRLRLPNPGLLDPLEDARTYVEQLAYSLDSINGYEGSKISLDPSVRARIRKALHLDQMMQEIRRTYRTCENRKRIQVSPPCTFLPKREQEIHKYFECREDSMATVTFLPTRGLIMELLGACSGSCIRRLTNLARTYEEATSIAFVVNEQFPLVMGGCLVFTGSLKDEPVLVIRGFNPTYELLDRVSTHEFFESFADYARDLATEGGFSAVAIAHADFWHNAGSVRAPVFFHLQDNYGSEPIQQLDDSQVVNFNGLSSRDVVVVRRVHRPKRPLG